MTSLLMPYQIPALMVVSMRGDAGEWNAAQVPMGRAVAADPRRDRRCRTSTPSRRPTRRGDVRLAGATRVRHAYCCARVSLPRRLTIVMNRLEATRGSWSASPATRRSWPASDIPAYDLFAAGDRPQNFYTWGSMGLASSIGLGLAAGAAGPARLRARRRRIAADEPRLARDHRLRSRPNLVVIVLGQRGVRDDRRAADADGARRRPRRRGARAGDRARPRRSGR